MNLQDLKTQIFYKSLYTAAERFYEKDPATALEIYRSYFRYAFGETEDIETDNEIAELLVRQNVPSLNASTENYLRACNQGPKGKENGGGVGRPRKGESPEQYKARVEEWKQSKNPKKPLKGDNDNNELEENPSKTPVISKSPSDTSQNPKKPLTYDYSLSLDIDNTYSSKETIEEEIYKDYSIEDFISNIRMACRKFIDRHREYNYYLNNESFKESYYENLLKFQLYVNDSFSWTFSIDDYIQFLKEEYLQTYQEEIKTA